MKRFIHNNMPLIIAGPCSVESEKQLRDTVMPLLSERRVSMIRCGVWKPRTRPGGFEGYGEEALRWMSRLNEEMGNRVEFCCEVATPLHVETCLKYGIGTVWIGARTSVNPFLVGELAAAMQGSGLSVMVKNPMTPDVSLWLGAIERILHAGIEDVAAIHRGFSTYNNQGYRNNPLWEIAIELKREMPETTMICDPSHIAGCRDLIEPLSQTALDLHFDGLMIECHASPNQALTDCQQQITPTTLTQILDRLQPRRHDETGSRELELLREQIDSIDGEILGLLSKRMHAADEIGRIKQASNMSLYQPQRWKKVMERQIIEGERLGLDEDFIKELMERIHSESIKRQGRKE